jgi:ubiquinone/menaquinone biosynthesis C-methylase UbiE
LEKRRGVLQLDRPLSARDKERLIGLYETRLDQFGHDAMTVGWKNRTDQWLRFSILCRDIVLSGKSILDVGCGLGDLVSFLDESGVHSYEYVGIDISPRLIQQANARFGRKNCRFLVTDLLEAPNLGRFDIVLCSGGLSFRVDDNISVAELMIRTMFEMCSEATVVNFLSTYVDFQLPKNFHYQPEAMFSLARSLTRWVKLYHDYPLYEFSLQMFRNSNSIISDPTMPRSNP